MDGQNELNSTLSVQSLCSDHKLAHGLNRGQREECSIPVNNMFKGEQPPSRQDAKKVNHSLIQEDPHYKNPGDEFTETLKKTGFSGDHSKNSHEPSPLFKNKKTSILHCGIFYAPPHFFHLKE
jgi:hypothetical protein